MVLSTNRAPVETTQWQKEWTAPLPDFTALSDSHVRLQIEAIVCFVFESRQLSQSCDQPRSFSRKPMELA